MELEEGLLDLGLVGSGVDLVDNGVSVLEVVETLVGLHGVDQHGVLVELLLGLSVYLGGNRLHNLGLRDGLLGLDSVELGRGSDFEGFLLNGVLDLLSLGLFLSVVLRFCHWFINLFFLFLILINFFFG